MELANSSVLVAGGASGLGAATARRLAGIAAHVVIADRDKALGSALAAELGARATFVRTDVTDADSIEQAIAAASAAAPLRVAVVTAGIGAAARTVKRD